MTDLINEFNVLAAISGLAIGLISWMSAYRVRLRRRAVELEATKASLEAHFAAMNAIVDDPALPIGALKVIVDFSDVISTRDECESFAEYFIRKNGSSRQKTPDWFAEMESLQSSRPDIVENFMMAMTTGFVAMFLRWPDNASKFELVVADFAADRNREAAMAEKVAKIGKARRSSKHDGDTHLPGGLVTA